MTLCWEIVEKQSQYSELPSALRKSKIVNPKTKFIYLFIYCFIFYINKPSKSIKVAECYEYLKDY